MARRLIWSALAAAVIAGVFAVSVLHSAAAHGNGSDGIPVNPAAQRSRTFANDWVVAENAKQGTTSWRLAHGKPSSRIEGFADRVSLDRGASFGLYVQTTAPRWRVIAYRIGWYHATGGRQVWTSRWVAAAAQPEATVSPKLRTVTARWRRSLEIGAAGWPAGSYLLKLQSSHGDENYVPMTVRSASTRGATVFMNEALTWQAYNSWGDYSLYRGRHGHADRSFEVSFDRPYDAMFTVRFFRFEQPLILRAERLGLPMAYLTDIDIAARPHVLQGARALIVPGHAEYWTRSERDAVLAARGRGMNIAEFGGNAQYWQVRLAATAHGADRAVICYKETGDPIARQHPESRTARWRDLPTPLPESQLFGVEYRCFPALGRYVVEEPSFFAFGGTGARRGSAYPGLIGEVDGAAPDSASLEVLTHSAVSCGARRAYSDSSYFVTPSHAGVFATGTTGWVGLLNGTGITRDATEKTVNFARQVTDNILFAFAAGPAGLRYPATPNAAPVAADPSPARSDD